MEELSGGMLRWFQSHSDQRAGELSVGGGGGGVWCGAVVAVVVTPPRRDGGTAGRSLERPAEDSLDEEPPRRADDAAAAASEATSPPLRAIFSSFWLAECCGEGEGDEAHCFEKTAATHDNMRNPAVAARREKRSKPRVEFHEVTASKDATGD